MLMTILEHDNQIMAVDNDHDDNSLQEDDSPNGERMSGENAAEALTRVELDLAYCSEKILNLEILLMQVAGKANDFEALNVEEEDFSNDSVEKAFELVILSGILDMEVKELQSFMTSLQIEIGDTRQNLPQNDSSGKSAAMMEEKLHDAEESVKKLQDLVADIGKQSAKFERTLSFYHRHDEGGELGNGDISPADTKWKLQTLDQQRHVLQMLEKSLARELDLDKKLSDSISHEGDLKLKLHYAERELYCMEESIEICFGRTLEAENAVELLLGISKELAGKVQVAHLNLNGAIQREHEMRARLEETMTRLSAEEVVQRSQSALTEVDDLKESLKEAEEKLAIASSDVLSLRDKVRELGDQLKDSDFQLQLANASVQTSQEQQSSLSSEISRMETAISDLNSDVFRNERSAESAEAKCIELGKTNMELVEEIDLLKTSGSARENLLERKLRELENQLEHAKVSVEAGEEQQNMLYATIVDMENTIKELKGKVLKAESRAENAESKCTLLTETNIELSEEVSFMRGRLVSLETSLHQVEDAKIATAKDIGIRTKIISDLVMKLALEREQLQLQISALTKKNKILSERCKAKDNICMLPSYKGTDNGTGFSLPKLAESSVTDMQVFKSATAMPVPVVEMGRETSVSAEYTSEADSKLETSRNIEAAQLDPKYFVTAIIVLLISVLTFYTMYQESSHA